MMKRLAVEMMSVELRQPGAHAGALMNSTEELVARVRLAVEILLNEREAIFTSHHSSPPRYGPILRRISARARCRSVLSFPTEKPVISAISS